MDDATKDARESICGQCGTQVQAGRIFCGNCGATLRAPAPLIQLASQANPPTMSSTKGMVVTAIKYLAGISAVVFWLCPLRTGTQVLIFVASIAVLLTCHFVRSSMDEDYANKNAGYWPKPIDWNPSSNSDGTSEKRASTEMKT
jgi:hypothetical protein